jgi:transposase-like protein
VEVDDANWVAPEEGAVGRRTEAKALIIVAAEVDGRGIGRIQMRRIPDLSRQTLHGFIADTIEPGATLRTDGLNACQELSGDYIHERLVQRRRSADPDALLPQVHRTVGLLKRWLMGTHQGAISHEHLDANLDEFVFRFTRGTSRSRGKLFYRLAQQAGQVEPVPYKALTAPQDCNAITEGAEGVSQRPQRTDYPEKRLLTRLVRRRASSKCRYIRFHIPSSCPMGTPDRCWSSQLFRTNHILR